ncbi:MAG: proline dehydrogenase family protein [Sporocytophaga sp.]|uniref:proline dehydrogenase family protein n=1 Tax=Sporocytophaga sp. TaxID=2231183 RepID=UPI001B1254F1|nr:proline dehydrogenase family protein [Sporocytophaga sp.]MBO9703091.1 proline dehydrogenase family protein [Sporocytophaga sp.]
MDNHNLVSFDDTSAAFSSRPDRELKKMNFLFTIMGMGKLTKIGSYFVKSALKWKLPVKKVIKNTLFNHFCGGENLDECKNAIDKLSSSGIKTILDYAVEAESSMAAYDHTMEVLRKSIDLAASDQNIPFVVFKMTALCRFSILEKTQSGIELNFTEKEEFSHFNQMVEKIAAYASSAGVRLMVDAEESWIQDTIDAVTLKLMSQYNKNNVLIFRTFQMYRVDMPFLLSYALKSAKESGYKLGIKLVRGAYMEKERKRALDLGYPSPIFPTKEETDQAFNEALEFCLNNLSHLAIVSGSHNEESNLFQTKIMASMKLNNNDNRVYFAQLYGMGDHISFNLARKRFNVGKYLPFGPLEAVMPYLLRRAEENKSIKGQTGRELSLIRKELERRKLKL